MRKGKPFIHILSNFYEFLSTQTPSAVAIKWLGSEACFEETEDQLSPRYFVNTGSTSFSCVECSYLVIIKPNHSRIFWYKIFSQSKNFNPPYVSISEGGVFRNLPRQRFRTTTFTGFRNRQINSDLVGIYNIPFDDVMKCVYQINKKTTRGDNRSMAITGRLPVDTT